MALEKMDQEVEVVEGYLKQEVMEQKVEVGQDKMAAVVKMNQEAEEVVVNFEPQLN